MTFWYLAYGAIALCGLGIGLSNDGALGLGIAAAVGAVIAGVRWLLVSRALPDTEAHTATVDDESPKKWVRFYLLIWGLLAIGLIINAIVVNLSD